MLPVEHARRHVRIVEHRLAKKLRIKNIERLIQIVFEYWLAEKLWIKQVLWRIQICLEHRLAKKLRVEHVLWRIHMGLQQRLAKLPRMERHPIDMQRMDRIAHRICIHQVREIAAFRTAAHVLC